MHAWKHRECIFYLLPTPSSTSFWIKNKMNKRFDLKIRKKGETQSSHPIFVFIYMWEERVHIYIYFCERKQFPFTSKLSWTTNLYNKSSFFHSCPSHRSLLLMMRKGINKSRWQSTKEKERKKYIYRSFFFISWKEKAQMNVGSHYPASFTHIHFLSQSFINSICVSIENYPLLHFLACLAYRCCCVMTRVY